MEAKQNNCLQAAVPPKKGRVKNEEKRKNKTPRGGGLPGKKIFVKNAICRFLLQPANSL